MYLSGIDHSGLVALYEVHIRPLPQRQALKRAHSERLKSGEELPAALAEGGAATGEGVEEGEQDGEDFLAGMLSDFAAEMEINSNDSDLCSDVGNDDADDDDGDFDSAQAIDVVEPHEHPQPQEEVLRPKDLLGETSAPVSTPPMYAAPKSTAQMLPGFGQEQAAPLPVGQQSDEGDEATPPPPTQPIAALPLPPPPLPPTLLPPPPSPLARLPPASAAASIKSTAFGHMENVAAADGGGSHSSSSGDEGVGVPFDTMVHQSQRQSKAAVLQVDVLICIDVEATCDEDDQSTGYKAAFTKDQQEIIELPFVAIDVASGSILHTEQQYITPEHTPLTPFCTKLTGITAAKLANGVTLEAAVARVDAYIAELTAAGQSFCFVAHGKKLSCAFIFLFCWGVGKGEEKVEQPRYRLASAIVHHSIASEAASVAYDGGKFPCTF